MTVETLIAAKRQYLEDCEYVQTKPLDRIRGWITKGEIAEAAGCWAQNVGHVEDKHPNRVNPETLHAIVEVYRALENVTLTEGAA